MPLLSASDLPRIIELVKAGVSDIEIGRRYGTCPQNVMKFRAKNGVFRGKRGIVLKPKGVPAPRPSQVGSYFDQAVRHEVKVMEPAFASGDLEFDDDSCDQAL
jgi:hypothetical protein